MNNYVQDGNVMQFTAPSGGVVAGSVYKIGQLVGVAAETVAQDLPFAFVVTGVVSGVPKATSQSWTEGAVVYWNGTAFTTTASSNTLAGVAAAAAGSSDTTGTVRLNGIAKAAES